LLLITTIPEMAESHPRLAEDDSICQPTPPKVTIKNPYPVAIAELRHVSASFNPKFTIILTPGLDLNGS